MDILTTDDKIALVLDQIKNTGPEHFNMSRWIRASDDPSVYGTGLENTNFDGIDINACGTVACIGGHTAVALHDRIGKSLWYPQDVVDQLDMPPGFMYPGEWPEEMLDVARRAAENEGGDTPRSMADAVGEWTAVVELFEHRIKAGGWTRFGEPGEVDADGFEIGREAS